MIHRYAPQDFILLWSDDTRYRTWLRVELAACRALEAAGLVPVGTSDSIEASTASLDAVRIEQIERTTRHDVIAFLTHVEELAGPAARWLHRGMTSSDVLDTGLAILLKEAASSLVDRMDALCEAVADQARRHGRTVMVGRSHGIHAEPVTFGLVLAGHHAELWRCVRHLKLARDTISFGKLSGAVGTYAHLSPEIERMAMASLGLSAETVSTQIVPRDRHAQFFASLALVAGSLERLAVNVRHWQRTEVAEARESFGKGQKGSSAMPHKRNPILSENLCGLARVVRSAVLPALENVALWHERDISHSSVERMIAPDATSTLAFMIDRAKAIMEGLVVDAERMRANLEQTRGLVFSQAVLLALVDAGVGRQQAYEIVQRNALACLDDAGSFRDHLLGDADVRGRVAEAVIERCFDLDHTLRYVDELVERGLARNNPDPN